MSLRRYNPARDSNEIEIVAILRKMDALVYPISSPGIPDLLVGYLGKWVTVEVKNKTGRLTPPQETFFRSARERHLPTYVCRSGDDVIKMLRELGNEKTTA